MAVRPTAFALAIEEFIVEKTKKEDKNSAFYKDILSKVNSGSFRRDAPDESKVWADGLSALVNDLEQDSRTKSKGRFFIDRIGQTCAGFNQYASACDVLIQAGPAAAVLIYGGARLLLQLGQKIHECYETVVDILEDIHCQVQCYNAFAQAYDASEHVQKLLVKSYKLIINFWLKASKLLTGHALTKLFSRNTQLSREWQKYRGDLARCKDQVWLAVEAAKADLRRQKTLQDQIRAKEQERKDTLISVQNWIRGSCDAEKLDFRHTVRDKLALRHGTSCEWLLVDDKFQCWRRASKSTSLWLSSSPGTGKSIMASHIAQTLQAEDLKVANYFFSFHDALQKTTVAAFKSLALQLLAMYESVPDSVMRIFTAETQSLPCTLSDVHTLVQLLQALLKQINRVHIIVDGLDECEDRALLLRLLPQILGATTHGVVKWLFTSRPEKEFRDCFAARKIAELEIPKDKLNEDVREFMADGIQGRLGIQSTDYLQHWVSASDGNFLWARLTLSILEGEGLTCEAEVDEALERFPTGLEGCYERTLCHLVRGRKSAEIKLAQNLFKILVATVQPPRLSEVSHAIAALHAFNSPSDDDYDTRRVPGKQVIELLCGGLVNFDRKVKGGELDPVLKFCHKSVRDFLTEDPYELGVSEEVAGFFVTHEEAQLLLGKACLRYLTYKRYCCPQDIQAMLQAEPHAFIRYAAAFWQHHLSDAAQSSEMHGKVLEFAQSPCFWNCLAIQTYTVPHIFAQYFEMKSGGFNYELDDDRRGNVVDIAYGSPLPLWFDDPNYGPRGGEIVRLMSRLVQRWHSVLNSQPAAFGQCIMDNDWEAQFEHRKEWRSNRLVSYSLQSPAEDSQESKPGSFEIVNVEKPGAAATFRVTVRSHSKNSKLLSWQIDTQKNTLAMAKQDCWIPASQSSEDRCNAYVVHQTEKGHLTLLELDTLTLVTESANDQDPTNVVTYQAPHTPQEPWHVRGHSQRSIFGGRGPDLVATFCSSSAPKLEQRMQDDDSGFFDDSNSDTSSISSDSIDSGLEDVGDNDKDDVSRCMLITCPGKSPIWYFWDEKSSLDDCRCAITSKMVLWTCRESEACVADLSTGEVKQLYLPEAATKDSVPARSKYRELRFSEDESVLYYLKYTAFQDDSGVKQNLVISVLNFSINDGEPLITRTGASCSIDYASAGSLQWPPIVRTWTAEHLHVALPRLSCDPKLLRLSLADLSANNAPTFGTLRDPIYFPSTTTERAPALYVFDAENEATKLVLTMNSEAPRGLRKHSPEAPIIMIWTLNRDADWRPWDERLDACSERYRTAQDACNRLRGSFVDPSQRFLVPIRSGVDWTRKAFVACL